MLMLKQGWRVLKWVTGRGRQGVVVLDVVVHVLLLIRRDEELVLVRCADLVR